MFCQTAEHGDSCGTGLSESNPDDDLYCSTEDTKPATFWLAVIASAS